MFQFLKYKLSAIALVASLAIQAQEAHLKDSAAGTTKGLPFKAEKYPMLYHKQTEIQKISATSFVKGSYLETTPAAFLTQSFTGRFAGLRTTQSTGEPGSDNVSLNLRGRAPIVILDGVPRPLTTINPEQIESVTILKDALSTAMFGIRGMNGAILLTTKKGQPNKDYFSMNVKAQAGVQSPIKVREFLGSYDYATLFNEALQNDGKAPFYSQADLDAYKNKTNPYTHPDVDWNETLLNNSSTFSRYTLGAEGGGSFGNYAVSLDYLDQKGMFKQFDDNIYSTNSEFKRYIFRTNLNAKISDKFSVFVNLFGRIRNSNAPGGGANDILDAIKSTPNNAYPVYNPNGSLGGFVNYTDNLWGQSVYTGYTKTNLRDGFADAGFNANLNKIVQGWWLKGVVSFNTATDQSIDRTKNFEVFKMNIGTANDTTYQRYGTQTSQGNTSSTDANSRQIFMQLSTGISRQFGKNGVDVMVLANMDKSTFNSELPNTFKTLAARVAYNYSEKYLAEAAVSYSGNNRFAEGNQYGFFPSAGLGWNLHKEEFMKNVKVINTFKVRTSYGLVGNSNPGYYLYRETYASATGAVFGSTPGSSTGLAISQLPSYRTYEKGLKLNVGFDAEFLNNHAYLSFDYYKNNLSDMIIAKGNSTTVLGAPIPQENLGKYEYSGIEFTAGYTNKVGRNFTYDVSGNFSTQQSNLVYNDQPNMPYNWMNRTGLPVGQTFGYLADGFVTTAGQGPVIEGYQSKPGDIKYKDLNGDGVINLYDRTAIGSTKPTMFYGLNINVKYKKFYAGLLFQGVMNNELLLTGSDTWEFQTNGRNQAFPHHLQRWTPATASTATYPRLSVGANPNNHITSSFWLQNGDYFRLKNAEVGYVFDGGLLTKANIKSVRVFVNGLNLFTISKFKRFDPEMAGANYSLQRVINGGVSVTF